ncbi:MAG: hypothetical protein AVDCRST_MAG85-1304, partial [uncultured Solirubrobacteraceae bacterium]
CSPTPTAVTGSSRCSTCCRCCSWSGSSRCGRSSTAVPRPPRALTGRRPIPSPRAPAILRP